MDTTSIKDALEYVNMSGRSVARQLNSSEQNFYNKMRRGGIGTQTDDELQKMASVLGASYFTFFQFPNGKRFGTYPTDAVDYRNKENKKEDFEPVKEKGLPFPLYRHTAEWVKASDLYKELDIRNATFKDWMKFKLRYEDENRKMSIGKPIQEGIDYITFEDDWLLSVELAKLIAPEIVKVKQE